MFILFAVTACSASQIPFVNVESNITTVSFTGKWSDVVETTGYFLDVATDSTFTNFITGYNNLNVGNVTSYNVIGLVSGTTSYYRDRGAKVYGTSPISSVVFVATNACNYTCFSKQFGGKGSDIVHEFIKTSDGGYAVAGITDSFGAGEYDIW